MRIVGESTGRKFQFIDALAERVAAVRGLEVEHLAAVGYHFYMHREVMGELFPDSRGLVTYRGIPVSWAPDIGPTQVYLQKVVGDFDDCQSCELE